MVSQAIQFAKSLLHVLGCFQLEKQNEAKFESGLNNKGFVILHNITSESGRFHNVLIQPVNALLKIQGSWTFLLWRHCFPPLCWSQRGHVLTWSYGEAQMSYFSSPSSFYQDEKSFLKKSRIILPSSLIGQDYIIYPRLNQSLVKGTQLLWL